MHKHNILPNKLATFIWYFIKPNRIKLSLFLLTAIYWSVDLSLRPYVIKIILDHVANSACQDAFISLKYPMMAYIGLQLLHIFVFRIYDFISLQFYPKLRANIIATLTEHVSGHSTTYFQNNFAGGLASRIKDVSKGSCEIIQLCIDRFISNGLGLLIASCTMAYIHPGLAGILIIWTVVFLSICIRAAKTSKHLAHRMSEAGSMMIGHIVDRFTNMLNVRLFSNKSHEQAYLKQHLKEIVHHDKKLRMFLIKLVTFQGLSTCAMVTSCLYFLIWARQQNLVSVGDFGLVLTLSVSIASSIWNLSYDISKFSEHIGSVSQGLSLIKTPKTNIKPKHLPNMIITKGEITFADVSFQYTDNQALFANTTITIPAGQKVGLVGYSGSGKTTFVNLILRLFNVSSGNILIDQQDISKHNATSLRNQISMIPQDPILFHRSLMDNIQYGNINASYADTILAAKKAHAHEFIQTMSEGYHTMVGERGLKLSGGQRQRIAIARAILKDAPVLLLDEATSALDTHTERQIQKSLFSLMQGKTTIIIAHRLSTLLQMDRILVFDNGSIVADGTHDELLAADGLYADLWHCQSNDPESETIAT